MGEKTKTRSRWVEVEWEEGGGTAVARPPLGPQGPILITIPPPRPLSPSFPTEREFEEIAALKFLAGEIVLNYEPSVEGEL